MNTTASPMLKLPPQPRLREMVSRADAERHSAAMAAWHTACYAARITARTPAVRHVDEPEAANVRIVAHVTLPGQAEATLRRKDYGAGYVEIHCDCDECCGPTGQEHFVNGTGHLCEHVAAYKHYL